MPSEIKKNIYAFAFSLMRRRMASKFINNLLNQTNITLFYYCSKYIV